jgi:branched-chain amino acid transport system permease protein
VETLAQNLVNGISIGAFYALIALGYTMVYGVLRLINFAHGDLSMWGAYLGYTLFGLLALLGLSPGPWALVPVLLVVMGLLGLVGVLLERAAYRPLRKAGRLPPVVSALGAAFLLQCLSRNLYGASYKTYPEAAALRGGIRLAGVLVGATQLLVAIACLALMAGLYLFVHRTRTGAAIRAVAFDPDAARLMGIDVDRTIALVFMIGPALGGAAGVMVAMRYGSFDFTLGWSFGLKAFIAAIVGGIGNIPGAMLGGMILGVVESLGAGYISPQWKDVIAYLLLAGILLLRPAGLLGERVVERT